MERERELKTDIICERERVRERQRENYIERLKSLASNSMTEDNSKILNLNS